ncbi:MAG: iron transporter FeoB, partial [Gemmatimonadales bacterium]
MTTAIVGRARAASGGGELVQLVSRTGRHDFLVALAGNPNTGKST